MRITADMTTDSGGPLIELADFQDDDGTGVKVTISQERVRLEVDSYSLRGRSIWLRPEDAVALASLLNVMAVKLVRDI